MNLGRPDEPEQDANASGYIVVHADEQRDSPQQTAAATVPVAKTIKYPGSNVSAGVVAHKSWAVTDSTYRPATYTLDAVNTGPAWADPTASVYVSLAQVRPE